MLALVFIGMTNYCAVLNKTTSVLDFEFTPLILTEVAMEEYMIKEEI